MPISVIDQQTIDGTGASTQTLTINAVPHGLIYLIFAFDSAGMAVGGVPQTPVPPTSVPALTWTRRGIFGVNNYFEIWYATYNGPAGTVAVTVNAGGTPPGNYGWAIYSFGGVNQTQPFDTANGLLFPTNGQSNVWNSSTFSTTYANELLVITTIWLAGANNPAPALGTANLSALTRLQVSPNNRNQVNPFISLVQYPTVNTSVQVTRGGNRSWDMVVDALIPDDDLVGAPGTHGGIDQACVYMPTAPTAAPAPAAVLAPTTSTPANTYSRCNGTYTSPSGASASGP